MHREQLPPQPSDEAQLRRLELNQACITIHHLSKKLCDVNVQVIFFVKVCELNFQRSCYIGPMPNRHEDRILTIIVVGVEQAMILVPHNMYIYIFQPKKYDLRDEKLKVEALFVQIMCELKKIPHIRTVKLFFYDHLHDVFNTERVGSQQSCDL